MVAQVLWNALDLWNLGNLGFGYARSFEEDKRSLHGSVLQVVKIKGSEVYVVSTEEMSFR